MRALGVGVRVAKGSQLGRPCSDGAVRRPASGPGTMTGDGLRSGMRKLWELFQTWAWRTTERVSPASREGGPGVSWEPLWPGKDPASSLAQGRHVGASCTFLLRRAKVLHGPSLQGRHWGLGAPLPGLAFPTFPALLLSCPFSPLFPPVLSSPPLWFVCLFDFFIMLC